MADIDTTAMVEELKTRSRDDLRIQEIYHAFKFGLTDRAMDLARTFVCDELGVVL